MKRKSIAPATVIAEKNVSLETSTKKPRRTKDSKLVEAAPVLIAPPASTIKPSKAEQQKRAADWANSQLNKTTGKTPSKLTTSEATKTTTPIEPKPVASKKITKKSNIVVPDSSIGISPASVLPVSVLPITTIPLPIPVIEPIAKQNKRASISRKKVLVYS